MIVLEQIGGLGAVDSFEPPVSDAFSDSEFAAQAATIAGLTKKLSALSGSLSAVPDGDKFEASFVQAIDAAETKLQGIVERINRSYTGLSGNDITALEHAKDAAVAEADRLWGFQTTAGDMTNLRNAQNKAAAAGKAVVAFKTQTAQVHGALTEYANVLGGLVTHLTKELKSRAGYVKLIAGRKKAFRDAHPPDVPKPSGSKDSAMTGGSALDNIPAWAKALGGAVLLGGVTFALMKVGRK